MSLFVVRHQHPAESCAAGHPQIGPMLLQHISADNAGRSGIKVHGEAVVDGSHTFYMILEAEDAEKVEQFMAPFAQAGSVETWRASSCERVVARAKC